MTFHSILRAATACSLLTGIMLVFGQATGPMGAQLTGPGSLALAPADATPEAMELHAAAYAFERSEAGTELAMGALFIVLGFVLHALLRHREERNVHITILPKKASPKVEKGEWYWMHLHV